MRTHRPPLIAGLLLACLLAFVAVDFAGSTPAKKDASADPAVRAIHADTMRIEGEKRFHANCGRCHAAPEKFPPRMMATVLRHMRVRATVTADDQKFILFYMTQ